MKKLLIVLLILKIKSYAQKNDENYTAPFIKNSKYLSYLIIPDSNTQAALFNIRYQYLYIPKDKPFRRGGISWNIGINLARFFTKKIILGLSVDTRFFFAGQTKQHFTNEFKNDFNSEFRTEYPTYKDSLRASVLYDGINGNNGVYVKGSFPGYYGISFSPFPQKWGGIMLEVKRGGTFFDFFGKYDAKTLDPHGENGPVNISTNKNLAIELSFKPNKFIKPNSGCLDNIKKPKDYLDLLVISLYYEQFSLVNAKFNGQNLNTMVSNKFIEKYSNRNYFGIKLGFGIY